MQTEGGLCFPSNKILFYCPKMHEMASAEPLGSAGVLLKQMKDFCLYKIDK